MLSDMTFNSRKNVSQSFIESQNTLSYNNLHMSEQKKKRGRKKKEDRKVDADAKLRRSTRKKRTPHTTSKPRHSENSKRKNFDQSQDVNPHTPPKKKRWRDLKIKKGAKVMNDPEKKPERRALPPRVEMLMDK
eukprot:UN24534